MKIGKKKTTDFEIESQEKLILFKEEKPDNSGNVKKKEKSKYPNTQTPKHPNKPASLFLTNTRQLLNRSHPLPKRE